MKKCLWLCIIVVFLLSACSPRATDSVSDESSINDSTENAQSTSSISRDDNQEEDTDIREQTFKWMGNEYTLQYRVGADGTSLAALVETREESPVSARIVALGEDKWLWLTVRVPQSEHSDAKVNTPYYLLWDPEAVMFRDVFVGSGLFRTSFEHSLIMNDKTADNTQFVFKAEVSQQFYYLNVPERKLYDLNIDTAAVILNDKGVLCLMGLTRPNEDEIRNAKFPGRTIMFTVECNYGACGVIDQEMTNDGKYISYLGFGKQELREDGLRIVCLAYRQENFYEELCEQYNTTAEISFGTALPQRINLSTLSQIPQTIVSFSETGVSVPSDIASVPTDHPAYSRVNIYEPYKRDGLDGIYVNVCDNVYEGKGYGEESSVYKLVDGEWERLPDLEYKDTLILDNGVSYDVDYLLAVDGGSIMQLAYNHKADQVDHVKIEIINGRSLLKFRPWITVEPGTYETMPPGYGVTADGKYLRLLDGYYLEWNPETGRFEDVFAGSGLWEYACAGRITIKDISDDGRFYLFSIDIPEHTLEGETGDYIFERGGELVPAHDSTMEAWLALDYNYSGH